MESGGVRVAILEDKQTWERIEFPEEDAVRRITEAPAKDAEIARLREALAAFLAKAVESKGLLDKVLGWDHAALEPLQSGIAAAQAALKGNQ
jgi:rRNA maturation endonuclease Nob1